MKTSGSFYATYPRHRQLISLNKRNTGERNYKFNLRHDWNSLLSDVDDLRFTRRSKKLFPSADILVEYLNDFYRHFDLRIEFNTTIRNLKPLTIDEQVEGKRFHMNDENGRSMSCRFVFYHSQ